MDKIKRKLIEKYIDGKCSSKERDQINKLLETEESKSGFLQIMLERDLDAALYKMSGPNEEELDYRVQNLKTKLNYQIAANKKNISDKLRGINILKNITSYIKGVFRNI